MKLKLFLLAPAVFFTTVLFAQIKATKPLTQKTVVTTPVEKKITNPQPVKTQNVPASKPTDLQSVAVNIVIGDDGKDDDTKVVIQLFDDNKRLAATYPNPANSRFPKDEYFAGETISLPMIMEANVPTGETKLVGALPLPVLREAQLGDFSAGGDLKIMIASNGHDTWKINSISITLNFNNDNSSPHRITWSNIVLSQDSRTRDLLFDKNFNPIQ